MILQLQEVFYGKNPTETLGIIDILTEKIVEFLVLQAKQGANALMLFDTWAGSVPDSWRSALIYELHQKLIERGSKIILTCHL